MKTVRSRMHNPYGGGYRRSQDVHKSLKDYDRTKNKTEAKAEIELSSILPEKHDNEGIVKKERQ